MTTRKKNAMNRHAHFKHTNQQQKKVDLRRTFMHIFLL